MRRPSHVAIYSVLKKIPSGRVVTYGQLAELSGLVRGHRQAAQAMRTCPAGLPWHRVVGRRDARRAQIALNDSVHAQEQRCRLEAEGVRFDPNGTISLERFGWLPLG